MRSLGGVSRAGTSHERGWAVLLLAAACGGATEPRARPDGPVEHGTEHGSEHGSKPAEPSKAPVSGRSVAAPEGTLDTTTVPGSILFVSERDGNLEVYRWRAGAELQRLTEDPRADFVGQVPADGSGWVRVITEDGASPEEHRERLWWVPTEGDAVPIGEPGRRARAAHWAPDRRFVVLETDREGAFSDIWRWDPSGSIRRLTHTEHGAFEPAVSPDGQQVAYVSTQDGNPELYVMAADGTNARRLTQWRRDDLSPRWSPDGTRLAFLRRERGGERLFVLDWSVPGEPAPGEPRAQRLVPTAEGERVKHADHTWSPDGSALAYTVHRPDTAPQIVVTTVEDRASRVVSPEHLRATMPDWSPQGRYLVFAGTEQQPDALDLYVVTRDGEAWARLTRDPAPDWLPRWSAR
ncbi:MAG: hypothetical protein AAGF11_45295 [Myxococcota bacterium]